MAASNAQGGREVVGVRRSAEEAAAPTNQSSLFCHVAYLFCSDPHSLLPTAYERRLVGEPTPSLSLNTPTAHALPVQALLLTAYEKMLVGEPGNAALREAVEAVLARWVGMVWVAVARVLAQGVACWQGSTVCCSAVPPYTSFVLLSHPTRLALHSLLAYATLHAGTLARWMLSWRSVPSSTAAWRPGPTWHVPPCSPCPSGRSAQACC